jgi:hypothetical protein
MIAADPINAFIFVSKIRLPMIIRAENKRSDNVRQDPQLTFSRFRRINLSAGVLVSTGTTATNRINAMTSVTMGLEKTEQEMLAFEVADEVLEIASGTAKERANFTLGACTGLSECPG